MDAQSGLEAEAAQAFAEIYETIPGVRDLQAGMFGRRPSRGRTRRRHVSEHPIAGELALFLEFLVMFAVVGWV